MSEIAYLILLLACLLTLSKNLWQLMMQRGAGGNFWYITTLALVLYIVGYSMLAAGLAIKL